MSVSSYVIYVAILVFHINMLNLNLGFTIISYPYYCPCKLALYIKPLTQHHPTYRLCSETPDMLEIGFAHLFS
jgi:hypothetical protein